MAQGEVADDLQEDAQGDKGGLSSGFEGP